MTTLVTPREVIDLAFADGGYLPPEAIGTVDIAAAEARYLLPVTGPALWQKLAEGEYPTLREEFAAPAAACAVRVAMQPALDLHGGIDGVSTISLVMQRLKAVQAEPVDMAVLILTGQTLVIFLVISSVICLAVAEEADVRTMVR